MGVNLSLPCPFSADNDIETALQSIVVKSVSLGGDDQVKTPERSISFNARNGSEPIILQKSLISGNMILEGSVSFKQTDSHTFISVVPTEDAVEVDKKCGELDNLTTPPPSPVGGFASPKHQAAVKLQKVYKSFRTRRKLADCAVLVEQSWWKLLDFAELKHSSISFFDIEQHETANSRWCRAKTRAAKLGKGLSKNCKAQKLALQHWLEAIDPRHRYGHNLHFYYAKWLESQCREPFFYWLDIGEGREITSEKCSRCKLQQQCIKYLGPMERKAYEVVVQDGRFWYRESGEILDTSSEPHAKWIFVLSTSKTLYVGKKNKGTFQHSSFLAGGATSAAGRLVVENGILKAVWPHSGHYKPTPENFQEFIAFLTENHVDLSNVKMDPVDEDEHSFGKQGSSLHLRSSPEEDFLAENVVKNVEDDSNTTHKPDSLRNQETATTPDHLGSTQLLRLSSNLTNLQIPARANLFERIHSETQASISSVEKLNVDDGYDSATESSCLDQGDPADKGDILEEEHKEDEPEIIPAASILQRINSHKESKSYQLGKQLSCKWTTGAGPRIGCVRDYPSELQFRALEQVNLSPRSAGLQMKTLFSPGRGAGSSPKASIPITRVSRTSVEQFSMQSSPLSKEIVQNSDLTKF